MRPQARCRTGLVSQFETLAYSCPMQDRRAKFEKLLIEAEDCALIAKFAPDERKRELFERLAADLRNLAHEIERVITAQKI